MRSCEDEHLCEEAQVHYYDLLCQEEAAVPAAVRQHVTICPVCREKMRRLRESLFEAQRPASPAGAWQDETVEALAEQFQLLGERVTCSEVKPLLPELALESPQIRIPTPVTVHVDHCPQCAADLAAIRELHLSAGQLKRLGRLLHGQRGAPSTRGLPARATAIPGSGSSEDTAIGCHDIAVADLFDCVIPSDSEPSGERPARERRNAIAWHVRSCPLCLRRMQTLQRTLGGIGARGDSEVVTVYRAKKDAEEASGEAEGEYPYPVSVQVLHSGFIAARDARTVRAALVTCLRKLERPAKPVAVLAALVLLGVGLTSLLRTTTPTASGTNLGDVDKTLAKMKNVYVIARDRQGRPTEEFWIARQLKILVHKTRENCVLYDLARDHRETLNLQTDVRTSEQLDSDGRSWALGVMANSLRRVVTEVTADTKLSPAEGGMPSGVDKGWDVYELPLPPNSRPGDRRLLYVDRATGLPQSMESYRQMPGADPKVPATTWTFTYLTEPEMHTAIEALFPAE